MLYRRVRISEVPCERGLTRWTVNWWRASYPWVIDLAKNDDTGALLSPFFVKAHTQSEHARQWCQSVQGHRPFFACVVGFTETALVPGISAAGATPKARRWTAIADAEVLLQGYSPRLPTAPEGYPSPVVISQAICSILEIPFEVFNCGLPEPLPHATLVQGHYSALPAACLSTGCALPQLRAQDLFEQGQLYGNQLAEQHPYLVIGECVVGGTTTALALLLALGIDANGMVNSSHPVCNHPQKLALVNQGLCALAQRSNARVYPPTALELVAALGDPMQPFVAGMALTASCLTPVLLAGGTQMLAVFALMQRLASEQNLAWEPRNVVVGTTRWVAEDPTGQSVTLAQKLKPVTLLATQLNFSQSCYPQLQAYERGYVKEGVGAGGLAIAASLYASWDQSNLLTAIEATYADLIQRSRPTL